MPNTQVDELLPCPFCGSGKISEDFGDESACIRCRDCGTQSGRVYFTADEVESDDFSRSEQAARDGWNRRAALEAHARALAQPLTEEVQRLKGERDLLCEVLRECDKVISTIEPESTDDDAGLRRLLGSIKRITLLHQADERDLFRTQGGMMNDDRTLLERAAKAAGYTIHASLMEQRRIACPDEIALALSDPGTTWWDPLNDDADALRLAVKLNIGVVSAVYTDRTCAWLYYKGRDGEFFEQHGKDIYAATRRAIVRAAAALAG